MHRGDVLAGRGKWLHELLPGSIHDRIVRHDLHILRRRQILNDIWPHHHMHRCLRRRHVLGRWVVVLHGVRRGEVRVHDRGVRVHELCRWQV